MLRDCRATIFSIYALLVCQSVNFQEHTEQINRN